MPEVSIRKAGGGAGAADAESVALRRLAAILKGEAAGTPLAALQQVTDLARELTDARYAALIVTGERDYVEGFVVSGLSPEEERKLRAAPQGHGPLGMMRQDGLAIRIDNLAEYEKAFGFPPKHPEMRTLLGVPIWLDGAVRGALYVTDRGGGEPFLSGDQVTLATLARHAAHLVATRWY